MTKICSIDETGGVDLDIQRLRRHLPEIPVAMRDTMPACPACGAVEGLIQFPPGLLQDADTRYSGCVACRAIWESLPDGEPFLRDGELMPFVEPCDNCAFRAGSPESQDKTRWRKLLAKLKRGGRFYCHKAVPISPHGGFEFPVKRGVQDATGELGPVEDEDRMRLCRGFLNAWWRWCAAERAIPTLVDVVTEEPPT